MFGNSSAAGSWRDMTAGMSLVAAAEAEIGVEQMRERIRQGQNARHAERLTEAVGWQKAAKRGEMAGGTALRAIVARMRELMRQPGEYRDRYQHLKELAWVACKVKYGDNYRPEPIDNYLGGSMR